jgi:hypothetical protein
MPRIPSSMSDTSPKNSEASITTSQVIASVASIG